MTTHKQKKTPNSFYIILFLIPVLTLIIFEILLRTFNYGNDYKEWISIDNKYEILNPDITSKYFSGIKNLPFSTESFLLKEKPKDSFRIITLGASSGAGYPYQNSGSFTKYIRKAFQNTVHNKKIEIANISMAAINSYTILDILPGIVEKKPDLVLIYLGHNEYYGALGVGSKLSVASPRFITNLIISLKEFRLYQLIENSIKNIISLTSNNSNQTDGTLMSKVASEKSIPLDSDLYKKGLSQFKGNLWDILNICKVNNIDVIIGTLTSNLKSLKPFISYKTDNEITAKNTFKKATKQYEQNNFSVADSLFRLAKDLDGLRFRAPEEFNNIIKSLATEFSITVADINSVMNKSSINGIVGKELMVDHLHPNLKGYQIIGKVFFNKIVERKFFNIENTSNVDSLVKLNYNFTKYDSTISNFRIKILKNNWPFKTKSNEISRKNILIPSSFESKVAIDVLDGKISRLQARLKLAERYEKEEKYTSVVNELIALVEEFPTEKELINNKIGQFINAKKYQFVGKLLKASYNLSPDAFNAKWLGILNFSNGKLEEAQKYFFESNSFNSSDPQVHFNIAGIYFQNKNYTKAYSYVSKCLSISPNYKNANHLKSQLEILLKNN